MVNKCGLQYEAFNTSCEVSHSSLARGGVWLARNGKPCIRLSSAALLAPLLIGFVYG